MCACARVRVCVCVSMDGPYHRSPKYNPHEYVLRYVALTVNSTCRSVTPPLVTRVAAVGFQLTDANLKWEPVTYVIFGILVSFGEKKERGVVCGDE